jgi:hypothetical protein
VYWCRKELLVCIPSQLLNKTITLHKPAVLTHKQHKLLTRMLVHSTIMHSLTKLNSLYGELHLSTTSFQNLATDLNKIRYLSLIEKNGMNVIFTNVGLVVPLLYNYVCLEFWSDRNVFWGYNILVAKSLVRGLPSVGFLHRSTISTTHNMEGSSFTFGLGRTLMLLPLCTLRNAQAMFVQWSCYTVEYWIFGTT